MLSKIKAFFGKAWQVIVKAAKWIARQVWAVFSDKDFDLDVYRLGGLAAYAVAGILALKTAAIVTTISEMKLGIMAGLVSAIAGIGTALFSQARKNDAGPSITAEPLGKLITGELRTPEQ